MRNIGFAATPGCTAATRIVLLPGAYHRPEDFEREGFVAALHSRGLAIDLEFIDPELRHVTDRAVFEELTCRVIVPARSAGCRTLWLGGVSLGGFLALAYAERYPKFIDGLCLLAPYVGNRGTTSEIARAGGLANWNPEPIADDDEERRVWRYVRQLNVQHLPIRLGLARQDRFGHGHQLLAATLPSHAVNIVDGGHDWQAWRAMWALFLDRTFAPATHHLSTPQGSVQ